MTGMGRRRGFSAGVIGDGWKGAVFSYPLPRVLVPTFSNFLFLSFYLSLNTALVKLRSSAAVCHASVID